MSGIVCAIRGGPDSRGAITKAISLARETRIPLHFLYVVNLDFLSQTSSSRVHTISEEMRQMGEFILLTAQAKAERQGVIAQASVRQGNVMDEIVAMCNQIKADYVILGRPRGAAEHNVFTRHLLEQFVSRLQMQTNAKVILANDEEDKSS
jgi:nucleotide-binding universal stress UspA family protein